LLRTAPPSGILPFLKCRAYFRVAVTLLGERTQNNQQIR
jgi:hypothetical protein